MSERNTRYSIIYETIIYMIYNTQQDSMGRCNIRLRAPVQTNITTVRLPCTQTIFHLKKTVSLITNINGLNS